MNLKSCDECGNVVDVNKLRFPHDIWKSDATIDNDLAAWSSDRDDFVAKVHCPVCQSDILKE